jgi:hypothetical protein
VGVAALGVYHGVNPAMGWLFAVALGLQERSARAVLQALVPIAVGHEGSIALAVLVVNGLQLVSGPETLRIVGAGMLVLFGLWRVLRPRWHPKWVGFRLTLPELALWSFLMSTAHGAGLMLLPIFLGLSGAGHHHAEAVPSVGASLAAAGAITVVHTLAMLGAMAAVALLVYAKLGVGILRRAWLNLDGVWAASLLGAGLITLFT